MEAGLGMLDLGKLGSQQPIRYDSLDPSIDPVPECQALRTYT